MPATAGFKPVLPGVRARLLRFETGKRRRYAAKFGLERSYLASLQVLFREKSTEIKKGPPYSREPYERSWRNHLAGKDCLLA